MLAISATDPDDQPAIFSSFGPHISLSAPGVGILSIFNHHGTTGYFPLDGTSMAAPMVSGIAALAWAYPSNQSLTNQQIAGKLTSAADDLGPMGRDPQFGYGRVNAARLFGLNARPSVAIARAFPAWLDESGGAVDLEMVGLDDQGVAGAQVRMAGPDGFDQTLNLARTGTTFRGRITLPPNPTGEVRRYATQVTVVDTTGLTNPIDGPIVHVNPPGRESWPQFQRDPTHRGESQTPVTLPPGTVWALDAGRFSQSLGVIANGGLYVTSDGEGSACGEIAKLDVRTGSKLWRQACGGRFEARAFAFDPAIDDGVFYFLDRAGRALAVADEGDQIRQTWQFYFTDTVRTGLTLAGDDLYFGTDQHLYRLDKRTGTLRWRTNLAGQSTPAASSGLIFAVVDASPAALVALDAATGQERWRQALSASSQLKSSPALAAGLVLVGDNAGFHAFDAVSGQPH